MKTLALEFYKCRRRWVWLAPLVMLAAQLAWGLWSFRNMSEAELQEGWCNILYTFPLLNAMMTPIVAAIVASRIADIEHKGQTLKLLETVQTAGSLFCAKFLCSVCYMAAYLLLQTAVMVIFGVLHGFVMPLPTVEIALYFVAVLLVTIVLVLFQLILSLLIPNQMIGMIFGLIGSFAGLFSLFFPTAVQKCIPWGYYGVLNVAAMDWNEQTRVTHYYFTSFDMRSLCVAAVFLVVLYCIGRRLFVRKEV